MWRRVGHDSLVWRTWGAEAAVFDPNTGDTHVLDALAGEVLRRVEANPIAAAALAGAMATDLDLGDPTALSGAVGAILARFAVLDLVEEVSA